MEHISKRFPGVLASDDISLSVGEGQILALVGENGYTSRMKAKYS